MQTHRAFDEPALSGEAPVRNPQAFTAMAASTPVRRVIARRAALELRPGEVVNFGFGIPGAVYNMLCESGAQDGYWLTIEQGIHNGAIIDGALFGATVNPGVVLPSTDQFDFYSGGGLDIACLGMGEMDAAGNVNVSQLNGRLIGPGGFVDISQNAKRVVFCGTFEAKGAQIAVDDGSLRVERPGDIAKLVKQVAAVTFSGARAQDTGQSVLYVTERAVFQLTASGVELIEVAPGVDLQTDILDRMGFTPVVRDPKPMNATLFKA